MGRGGWGGVWQGQCACYGVKSKISFAEVIGVSGQDLRFEDFKVNFTGLYKYW